MIEACLKRKIISKFLKKYKDKRWNTIIPSLLEIAILYLYNNFKKTFYSEDDLLEIIENLKSLGITHISDQSKIKHFRNDYKLDIYNCLLRNRNSHRSYSKKAKNINELNVYTNYNIDNKIIHYYNRSSEVTPIKRLINYSEIEESSNSNKFKKFWKLEKVINAQKDNIKIIKNNNISKNKSINYNTIDISNTNRGDNTYLSNNNSILLNDNNKEKEYIKVNKVHKEKKTKNNRISIEDLNYNNTYIKDMSKEINDKIDKNSKIQNINNLKPEDILLTNYNQRNVYKEKEKKINYINNFFLNKHKNLSSKRSKNSINHLSYIKDTDYNSVTKPKKIRNLYSKNMKKISIKDLRNKQILSVKKNVMNDENDDIINNELITDDMRNDNKENIDDINIYETFRITTNINKNRRKFKLITENKKSNIINYNSFNNDINSKNKTFINDPFFFVKATNKKRNLIKKL